MNSFGILASFARTVTRMAPRSVRNGPCYFCTLPAARTYVCECPGAAWERTIYLCESCRSEIIELNPKLDEPVRARE
jgi:hypothetical protein